MDTRNSELFLSTKSIIYTPKPTRVRRCDTSSTWSQTKISSGYRREMISPKCPFALVKGKSLNFDQHIDLEELDKDYNESKPQSDEFETQREILSILRDSSCQEFDDCEYEIVERARNPFYDNLNLDE